MQRERILGIDPGSRVIGFGVLDRRASAGMLGVVHVAHGALRPQLRSAMPARLAEIYRMVSDVLRIHEPDRAVVEQVFVAASPHAAIVLGQARGAVLAALGAAGVPVDEIAARAAKKAITGSGAAGKQQVQAMVARLLGLSKLPPPDAADALALAMARARLSTLAGVELSSRRGRSRGSSRAAWTRMWQVAVAERVL